MLIVDDERIDREGVAYLVKKFEFPIQTYMADSVDEAVAMLEEQDFDILFTDICMPGRTGLDLIRESKNLHPDLQCIIYSAYGEFEYAKQAMRYQVRHYILKPLKMDEFQETLQSVIKNCEKNLTDKRREKVINLLLLGRTVDDDSWDIIGNVMLIDVSTPLFADARFDIDKMMEDAFGKVFWVSLNEYQSVIFCNDPVDSIKSRAEMFCHTVEQKTGSVVTAILGGRISSPKELLSAYSNMEAKLDSKFYFKGSQVLSAGRKSGSCEDEYLDRLQDVKIYIQRGEKLRALTEIDYLFQEMEQSGALSPLYVKFICMNLLHNCVETNSNISRDTVYGYVEQLFHCNNIYELWDNMRRILSDTLEENTLDERNVIREVLEIVEKEFDKDISLEQIADRVFLTPSYLSYYFKKETGKNFIKYLTVFRLEKAKELLRTTDIKVTTISRMVGYMNPSYFCMLFKNYTGKTPISYREETQVC